MTMEKQMREFAIVKDIKKNPITNENEVFVLPMIISACQTCKSGCRKQGRAFQVLNKHKLTVKIGSTVRIGLSKPIYTLHGALALILPIFCAVLGFIFTPKLSTYIFNANIIEKHFEIIRAGGISIFFLISATMLYIINRSSLHFTKPEILQVISD